MKILKQYPYRIVSLVYIVHRNTTNQQTQRLKCQFEIFFLFLQYGLTDFVYHTNKCLKSIYTVSICYNYIHLIICSVCVVSFCFLEKWSFWYILEVAMKQSSWIPTRITQINDIDCPCTSVQRTFVANLLRK